MSDTWELHWTDGGEARVVTTDGNFATLHSTRQAATGTPLSATVRMKSGTSVRFKVKDCRRLDEHVFLLVGRWVDLSKAMREEMVAASSDKTPSSS